MRARILSIDKDAGRLSLGLKPSYFATIEVSKDVEDEGEADFDEQADVLMADEDEDNEISGEDGLREAESDDKESGSEDEDAEEEAADIDAMDEDTDQDEATASQSKPANFLIDSLDAANIDLGGWGEVVLGDETVTAGDVEADNHHDKHKKNKVQSANVECNPLRSGIISIGSWFGLLFFCWKLRRQRNVKRERRRLRFDGRSLRGSRTKAHQPARSSSSRRSWHHQTAPSSGSSTWHSLYHWAKLARLEA